MTDSSKPEFFIEDVEWAQKLEADYQEYMNKCTELVYEEGPEESNEEFVPLSKEIFCGCETCSSREQLFFLVPKIIKAYKEGKISLPEDVTK
jgi:hypothetical protein